MRDSGECAAAPADGVVMIYATYPTREGALAVARDLVERRLAAAVNLVPSVTSVFEWKGKLETVDEVLMMVKLPAETASTAVEYIAAHHPYEVPGILTLPVLGGSGDYLAWVRGISSGQ